MCKSSERRLPPSPHLPPHKKSEAPKSDNGQALRHQLAQDTVKIRNLVKKSYDKGMLSFIYLTQYFNTGASH